MFKNVLMACLLMSSVSAFAACEIPTQGLPESTITQMKQICEEGLAKNSGKLVTKENIELVTTIGGVAKEFAASLGIAAKELGIAANEFLTTPAGMLTAFVILWKTFLIQFIGIILMIVVLKAGVVINRQILVVSTEHVPVKTWRGEKVVTRKTYSNFSDLDDNQLIAFGVVSLVSIALCGIILVNMVAH